MTRALKAHSRDVIAIALLLVFGLSVTGYILSQQQVPYPSWIPILGDERFELKAELSSAQAVTPGQGQTVNVSGIEVGDVTEVELDQGKAVVTMAVEEQYAPLIHTDATLLLRPRTGLQDQTLEVDVGSQKAPVVEEGATIPLAQTQPNIQPDKILASLDADTRAYLRLLLEGGARGLGEHGEELSAILRRFEPTARDLAKINGKLSKRQANIRRAITNFKLVSLELGARDTQLAEFVQGSDAALGDFAAEEASIRESLQELPSALAATRRALDSGNSLSLELGPASAALIPSAEALGPALRETRPFLRETVAPIRDQIRPFTRQVQPPVRKLRDAAVALNKATPPLRGAFGDVNTLLNTLAFNPPGNEEGFLFYAAWLNHTTNSLFALQDAHGPLRRGLVLFSCGTGRLAEGVANVNANLRTLQQLTRVPTVAEISADDPAECTP